MVINFIVEYQNHHLNLIKYLKNNKTCLITFKIVPFSTESKGHANAVMATGISAVSIGKVSHPVPGGARAPLGQMSALCLDSGSWQ